jgi:TP901 family phage tail tape measure protein
VAVTRTVSVKLTADLTDLRSKFREGGAAVRQLTGELKKAADSGHLEKVSDRAAIMGTSLIGVAGAAVKMSMDFDKAMSSVSAATHAGAGDLQKLRSAALQAGKDTQYSATQAANAITELAKAGVPLPSILGGGLKGALSLAAAGQMDVAEAAQDAATAIGQFKLAGSQVPHVADLLAAGAGKAQGSVRDMGMALNQAGLVSGQFSLSIEDTTGVLAEFAHAGLLGSDAGTSLRTMLLAIANPSKQTRDLMDDLGISFYDASGKFIGMSGVAQVLQTRLKGLTDAQRQQALGQIFGNDAIRSASVLYSDGAKGVETWKNAVNDSGYAAATAQKQTDNLAGDIERLKGSLETLAIQSGSGSNSGLRVLAKGVNSVVDEFNDLPPAVSGGITVLAGLSGGALLLGAGWVKLRKSTKDVRAELEAMGPTGTKAAAGMSRLSSAAGKAGAAFVALQIADQVVSHFQKDLNPQLDAMSAGLEKYAANGQLAGEASRVLGSNLDDLKVGFKFLADDSGRSKTVKNLQEGLESIVPGLAGTNTSIAKTQERVQALDGALSQLVAGGHTQQAQAAFTRLASQLAVSGVSMDEFKKQFPQYAAALETAGQATSAAAGKTGDLTSALQIGAGAQDKYKTTADAVAGAARGEREALGALFSELKAETDPVFGLIDAQQKLRAAQKSYTSAVKAHGKNSSEAKAADLDLAQAALALQNGVSNLSTSFNGKLSPAFVATLQAAGLTKGQIADVRKQFEAAKKSADKYDGKYAADVSAPGAKGSKKQLDDAYTAANHFAGPYVADVSVSGAAAAEAKLKRLSVYQQALKSGKIPAGFNGPIKGPGGKYYAEGGWTGPGGTWQPAGIVHADEFVIRKSSRQKIEAKAPGLLDEMNTTGYVPGYASGGLVALPFPVNASKTRIPSKSAVADAVVPAGGGAAPGGGQTYKWILAVVKAAFPGLHATSTFRPGAITLSGNRSYHAVGRAVDWPPSKALAEWVNARYFGATRELITPWNSLNIKNGARHTYTGDIYAQHAGTGRFKGNAHDHWAMANGGVIPEHVIGVGRSGRTYEFGERGPERVTPLRGYASGGLVSYASPGSSSSPGSGSRLDTADAMLAARSAVDQLTASLKQNSRTWSMATQKGRDNRSALISGVQAAQAAAKAKYDETGSVKAANKVYADYIRMLDAALKKMKVNAATRRSLIKAYSEQPTYDIAAPKNSSGIIGQVQGRIGAQEQVDAAKNFFAWTKPTFTSTTEQGRAELNQLFSYLSAAQQAAQSTFDNTGIRSRANDVYNAYMNQLRAILGRYMSKAAIDTLIKTYGRITLQSTSNRWGGLYQHAATGVLRDAEVAGAGPTRYAWAEPATGGELFAPKNGNLAKTRSEVGWAVSHWWGGQVNWQPGGQQAVAGRTVVVDATIPITLGAETITRQVRLEVDTALGQVAAATVYQTA